MDINRLRQWIVSGMMVGILLVPGFVAAQAADDSAPKPPEFSAALISCLKSALGSEYAAIVTPETEPTDEQIEKGEPCFEQFGPKIDPASQPKAEDLKFAPGTEKCLKEALGDGFRSEFASQKSKEQAKAFRSKTKSCFGKNVAGNSPGELPADVKSCIVSAVGQSAADEMLKGKPPEPGSDLFKKVENAKCFKNFGPPPGNDRPNLSPESKACVEKIMGQKFEDARSEPSEEQKQQIGKECFGGGGPNGQGGPQMPKEVQSCLESSFGDALDDLKKGPEFMTEEQKQKADACFKANNFNPGGPGGPNGQGGPAPDPKTQECIKRITGSDRPENMPEEQKQKVGKECFGGGQPGGPNGQGGPGGPGNLDPTKQACVDKITGGRDGRNLSEDQKQQIGRECFGNQGGPGGGPGSPGGPGPNGGPPQGQDPAKEECIKRITGGKNFDQQTEDDRQKVGKECFGNQGQGPNGQPNGQPGQPPQNFQGEQNRGPQNQPGNQPNGQPNSIQPNTGQGGPNNPPLNGVGDNQLAPLPNKATDETSGDGATDDTSGDGASGNSSSSQ